MAATSPWVSYLFFGISLIMVFGLYACSEGIFTHRLYLNAEIVFINISNVFDGGMLKR